MSAKKSCRPCIAPGRPLPFPIRLDDFLRLFSKAKEERVHPEDCRQPWTAAPCWVWTNGKDSNGYGFVKWAGAKQWAHRVAFQLVNGPLIEGQQVDHLCFNPSCINPAHLRAMSHPENAGRTRRNKQLIPF
jgi:hypothetical protein